MIDTEPVINLAMNVPSGLAPEPAPFPFATYNVEPSAETATAVGYQPTGINPATRIAGGSDRKSTRLNSSHSQISYAVFCLKKKKKQQQRRHSDISRRTSLLAAT